MDETGSGRRLPKLSVDGERFRLDDELFDLWGIRTASATASDAHCDHLLAQLDDYEAHGVNAVTVFYQGSSGANHDPFSTDGHSIDQSHQQRMKRIIEACADREMVVIVGIFYQNAPFGLEDANAVREAVRTVATSLRPYGNVIINIANEHTSHNWARVADVFDFRDPERILELCRLVHEVDPERLVGGGGFHTETCTVIGRSDDADVLLFDTGSPELTQHDSGRMYDRFQRAGVTDKPIVNVELFGGWTGEFPRGVFPPEARKAYEEEVERAAVQPGLSVCFHNNRWCQSPGFPLRYDLAGLGTADDPGIRWYFELVRAARNRIENRSGAVERDS